MANKTDYILEALGLKVEGKELSVEEIGKVFQDFKEAKKVLEDYEKKVLKPYFFSGAENFGEQTENGGHKVVLEDGTGWEKQARVSVKVDTEKAVDLLDSKNLFEFIDYNESISEENLETVIKFLKAHNREDLITTSTSVTNESLEQAYLGGNISDEELQDLITRKVTYALVEVKKPKKK
jgi:collagenase-like PrtC family protease